MIRCLFMIKLSSIEQVGWSCPSQWDAMTLGGAWAQIRYRYGLFSVSVDGRELFVRPIGDPLDGTMNTATMIGHLEGAGLIAEEVANG